MSADPWSVEAYQDLIHRAVTIAVPDGILCYKVKSRSDPKVEYRVELDSYDANGECSCKDFATRFAPLLKRGYTGRRAFEEGLIKKLRPWQFSPDDALRCFHVVESRREAADAFIRAIMKLEKQREQRMNHEPIHHA